jgi:hypothetical protein
MGGSKMKFGAAPLWTWVTGKKSFKDSLRTSGSPLEQAINKSIVGSGAAAKKKRLAGGAGGKQKYDPMMAYLSDMQAQQAAQAEAARQAQQQALLEAQQQSAMASARQGEMGAQQFLSQAGAMQQAKDIAALQAQQQSASAAGQAAVGGGFDIAKAREEQAANLAGTGTIPTGAALPFYGMDEAAKPASAIRSANVFNLPKTTGLTFGGK